MQWEKLSVARRACGHDWKYLTAVSADPAGEVLAVVLTRWPSYLDEGWSDGGALLITHVARNTIRFPFGRGPGRPGMRTDGEIEAMFALAQGYAERYEAGEDLTGYPEWTYRRLLAGYRPGDNAAFLASGNPHDCRYC